MLRLSREVAAFAAGAVVLAGLNAVTANPAAAASVRAEESSAAETASSAERPDAVSAMATARVSGERVEDLSQRDGYMRLFANPDGTWTSEEASDLVRVQDDAGEWHDIDATLVETDGGWAPAYAASDLVVSDGGERTFAELSESGRDLAWRWTSNLPQPVIEGATATYAGVAPGDGDLVVTATTWGFSYDVVLNEAPTEAVEFPVPVVTDGATLRETATGVLQVREGDGNVVAGAPRPVMWDSADVDGEMTGKSAAVDTVIERPATGPDRVVLRPGDEFLSDPDTVYPVTVDPTWTIRASGDAWVQNAGFTNGQVESPELRSGTYDGGDHKARSFIRFGRGDDLWDGNTQIISSDLVLRNFYSNSCNGAQTRVRAITQDWSVHDLTWGNQPNVGSRYASNSGAKGASGCPAADLRWDVTSITQDWANGTVTNHGLRVGAFDETNNASWRKYRSANYSTVGDRPTLEITYNSHPNTPGQLTVAPRNGAGPVAAVNPTISAPVSDPDGGQVRAHFEIFETGSQDLLWSQTSDWVTSGNVASVTVPTSLLNDGGSYAVKARANDGSLDSENWSPAASFVVDLSTVATSPPMIIGSPEVGPGGDGWVETLTPTLTAKYADADSSTVDIQFDVLDAGVTIWSGLANDVEAGASGTVTVPHGILQHNQRFTVTTTATDGIHHSTTSLTSELIARPCEVFDENGDPLCPSGEDVPSNVIQEEQEYFGVVPESPDYIDSDPAIDDSDVPAEVEAIVNGEDLPSTGELSEFGTATIETSIEETDPTMQQAASVRWAACQVRSEHPHWSVKGKTVLTKARVKCWGNYGPSVRVDLGCYLSARRTLNDPARWAAVNLDTRTIGLTSTWSAPVYCPKKGLGLHIRGNNRYFSGLGAITIQSPGLGKKRGYDGTPWVRINRP